jgi:BON domain-containing protein
VYRTASSFPTKSSAGNHYLPTCGDIAARAESRLVESGYMALRWILCDASEGVLILRGRVPTYFLKQLAQERVAEVEGVRAVVNEIEVVAPAPRSAEGRTRLGNLPSFVAPHGQPRNWLSRA